MIVKLIGKLELINKDSIHIEVSGIVYKIFMSSKDLNVLDPEIKNLEIEINEIFRDDVRYLFGFLHLNSKIMFENLIKVHGVGGKMALNVLSLLEISEMIEAVKNNNFISFTKVSGIGNKLGQRLIFSAKLLRGFLLSAIALATSNAVISPSPVGKKSLATRWPDDSPPKLEFFFFINSATFLSPTSESETEILCLRKLASNPELL